MEDFNLTVSTLPAAEVARLKDMYVPISGSWARESDFTGRPGSALLKALRQAPGQLIAFILTFRVSS